MPRVRYIDWGCWEDDLVACPVKHKTVEKAESCLKKEFPHFRRHHKMWGIPLPVLWGMVVRYEDETPQAVERFIVEKA